MPSMPFMDEYNISEINNKKEWEDFTLSVDNPSYFQSWAWGEVMRRNGVETIRLGLFKKNTLQAVAQLFDIKARRGHYFHCRQGPVFKTISKEANHSLWEEIKKRAIEKKVSFTRVSPLIAENDAFITEFSLQSPIHNQDGENRWILPLHKSSEELLIGMRKTTRYMIRKAEKEQVRVVRSRDASSVDVFLNLYKETSELKGFIAHSSLKEEFEEFNKDYAMYTYTAYVNSKAIASALIVHFGDEAIYRHGATSREGRRSPSSYLIQWQAILDARQKGLKFYNFWGVAENEDKNHPWFGLTQFKKGFGGESANFMHARDIPYKPSYFFTYLVDYYTKVRKGYGFF